MLILRDNHKEHLEYVATLPPDVLDSFCKMAVDTLRNGTNPKAYQNAAHKLGCEVEKVSRGVEGMSHLLTLGCCGDSSDGDMEGTLISLGFDEEQQKVVVQHFVMNKDGIQRALRHVPVPDVPHYADLDWRTEVQVASRSLQHQLEPVITFQLGLETQLNGRENVILQTDPRNLQHMTQVLEGALMEARGQYTRRVQRNIK